MVRQGNETYTTKGLPLNLQGNCHFHGKVVSHGNVSAAISNCKDLMGTIMMDDHFLLLQAIPKRFKSDQVYLRNSAAFLILNPDAAFLYYIYLINNFKFLHFLMVILPTHLRCVPGTYGIFNI